ncbi:nucleoside hydrolase [Kineococcus arenarius]|uniref:nucleoside hydrolase n=1 Tax=unclassified Kineococcus TaxID=2621656 RepID=UPI003D7D961B
MATTPRTTRTVRLVVDTDTDAEDEADDQYAVVHALLSETLDVRGIVPAHFGTDRSATSMADSRAEVDLLLELLGRTGSVRVADGAPVALPDERTAVDSPGARLIVQEALADDDRPLFVTLLGPLTDMATALLLEPRTAERDLTVVWIGGPSHDGVRDGPKPEFNLSNDVHAANAVFGSGVELWQVPRSVHTRVGVGYAELEERVAPCGRIGRYLVDQLVAWNDEHHPRAVEHRSLGDSPAIGAVLNPQGAVWRRRVAPRFTEECTMTGGADPERTLLVCEEFDTRYLLEDFFAKLRRSTRG